MNNDLKSLFDRLDTINPITLRYINQGLNFILSYVNDQWHMFSRTHLRINEATLHTNVKVMDEFKSLMKNYGYSIDDLDKEYFYEFRLLSDKYH